MASEDDQTAATKKATGKRQPAKRSTSKKPARKATAKNSATATDARTTSGQSGSRGRASAPKAASRPELGATEVGRAAIAEVAGMTGHDIESITSLERTDEGWRVEVQAVELRRVPSTTDVLATYEVLVDSRGELQGYRRVGRFSRGDTRGDQ